MVVGALVGLLLLALIVSRVAGHLSRQLSRPLNELVGWTERIAHGEPLPPETPVRGAPEFETLRRRMRSMSDELDRDVRAHSKPSGCERFAKARAVLPMNSRTR
jgi:nitrogen fixation/metabolism regulation signal transduction histidine kinase